MICSVPFAGIAYNGSVDIGPFGIRLFAAPSDPDAQPHMATIEFDPTPEQADAIAAAVIDWAAAVRAQQSAAAQMEFLALLS